MARWTPLRAARVSSAPAMPNHLRATAGRHAARGREITPCNDGRVRAPCILVERLGLDLVRQPAIRHAERRAFGDRYLLPRKKCLTTAVTQSARIQSD
jgi:hypothetical protein